MSVESGDLPGPVQPDEPRFEVRGIVVAHGEMARGMITAVSRIAGDGADALVAVSNEGRGPDELRAAIAEVLGTGPGVVFTDLGAGSCTLAAVRSCRDRGAVAVVSGVNLPMLLEFSFNRTRPLPELLERLEQKARDGIRVLVRS